MKNLAGSSNFGIAALLFFFTLGFASADVIKIVDARSEPWDPILNARFAFDNVGAVGPTIYKSGLDFTAGTTLMITYVRGRATTNVNDTPPFYADANGYCCNVAGFDSFPSLYLGGTVLLNAVVGAFTDKTGLILGVPFYVGDGPVLRTVPTGASQLQLGINDNVFNDNGNSALVGAIQMRVSLPNCPSISAVAAASIESTPEPTSFALLAMGLLLTGLRCRVWRSREPEASRENALKLSPRVS